MKQLCVYTKSTKRLHLTLEHSFENNLGLSRIKELYQNQKLDYVYFGNDLCENKIPSIAEIDEMISYLDKKNLKFVFVTPNVTMFGMQKVKEILSFFSNQKVFFDVVFNDWGVFSLIKKEYQQFSLIAGRLLHGMIKDPRINLEQVKKTLTPVGEKYFKSSNGLSKKYQKMLLDVHVVRLELDNPPQGLHIGETLIPISMYVPYGIVTRGRICMFREGNDAGTGNYRVDGSCDNLCKNYYQRMWTEVPGQVGDSSHVELFRQGNAIEYFNDNLNYIINSSYIDRIIYQPDF